LSSIGAERGCATSWGACIAVGGGVGVGGTTQAASKLRSTIVGTNALNLRMGFLLFKIDTPGQLRGK
jgi:hypothetical protein